MGAWRIRAVPGVDVDGLADLLVALEDGAWPPGAQRVKRSRVREVARVVLPGGEAAFVKHVRVPRRGGARLRRSQAAQEMRALLRLRERGLPAVEPLFLAERRGGGRGRRSVLATRELPGAERLRDRLARARPEERRALLGELGALVRRIHDAGLWHRDLHTGNVLVRPGGAGGPRLVLVDVQKLASMPGGVPAPLRHRDLGTLAHDLSDLLDAAEQDAWLEGYAAAGGADPTRLRRAVERAAARRGRRRLRSRGRRCVVPSSGFRVERHGGRRIFRRADMPRESIDAALAAHAKRSRGPAGAGAWRRESAVGALLGGPPPGPPARAFRRGQGSPEPGAPAHARVRVVEWRERGAGRWLGWLRGGAGRRAWRSAHALLLRGFETPAPLALVEEREGPWLGRSFLLVRDEPRVAMAGGDEPSRQRIARFAEALHAAGVLAAARGPQRVAVRESDPEGALLLEEPGTVRVCARVSPRAARADLERLLAGAAGPPVGGAVQDAASSSR